MDMADLSAFPKKGSQLLFSDGVKDDLNIVDTKLQTCYFRRIGAKNAVFKDSSLTQCLFEDSYLRKASFRNTDFTGSTFRNCNMGRASFQGCNFSYCTFHTTRLDRDEIIGCLPIEPNLKLDLARSLRRNFEELGDKGSADAFLNLEIEAHEQELLGALRRKTEYYRSHYTGVDQAVAGLKYVGSKLSGLIWGYGHRVRRLLASYIILTFLFALITYFFQFPYGVAEQTSGQALGFWDSMYYTFTGTLSFGTGPFIPLSATAKVLQLCVGFLGTLFLALLAAAIYRRIAR